MSMRSLACYVLGLMALGLLANVVDPEMTSAWMRAAFLMLGVAFFGEISILGAVTAKPR